MVTDTGVLIGTTNPAYNLDVTGYINTTTRYDLGGMAFAHNHGTNNTFVGVSAGNFTGFGNSNTAVGTGALLMNTDGSFNTAVGRNALTANTTGNQNTAAGNGALATLVGGGSNTGLGFSALNGTSAGSNNTAAGATALESNTGNNNTALGAQALRNKTSGDNNLAVGSFAGANISTGSNNIDIGNGGDAADSSTIRIGTLNQNRIFITAIRGVTTDTQTAIPVLIDPLGQLGTASSSRRVKFDIADMDGATDGLMQLRPVTFRYIAHGPNAALQYGLIAEEVEEIYPELVAHDKDGQVEAVAYQFLAPMLLNEVQKQHRKIEEQQRTIDALRAQVDGLARLLKGIEK
jgi:hypothetical protein